MGDDLDRSVVILPFPPFLGWGKIAALNEEDIVI